MKTLLNTLELYQLPISCHPIKQCLVQASPFRLPLHFLPCALFVVALLLNSGCSFQSPVAQPAGTEHSTAREALATNEAAKLSKSTEQAAELPSEPMTEQTLLNLLIGELAYQERNIPLAVEKYLEEALRTRDLAVAEHTARLAYFGRQAEAAMTAAQLWYELNPSDERAANLYADLSAKTGNPFAVIKLFRAQLERSQSPSFEILLSARYPKDELEQDKILDEIGNLLADYPAQDALIYTYAGLLQKKQRYQYAYDLIEEKHSDKNEIRVILLQAQLLQQLGQNKSTLKRIEKAIKNTPEEDSLQRYYAQLLTLDATNLTLAEEQLAKLILIHPNDSDLLRSHSLVALENQHLDSATSSANELIRLGQYSDGGHYLLGEIALIENDLAQAEQHFRAVKPGQYFLSAVQQIVNLLNQQQYLNQAREYLAQLRNNHALQAPNFWVMESNLLKGNDQAIEAHVVLSDAIALFPEQLLLRVERSFISETFDDIDMAEADLRFVLERDPDNVIALNALGYALSNHSTRYEEALELIEQAITIRPEDPAIIDSLGWVQFRLGQMDSAIENLKRAYEQFADDEIAAHLIEVYWINDKKRAAKSIVKKFKREGSPHPRISETTERLGIPH